MLLSWRLFAVATTIASLYNTASAHSQSRQALKYLSLIENPVIQAPSHRVHANSHFDITLNLHRKEQRIKLTLEPSHGIVAEGASVSYLDQDGNVIRTEAIDRNEHKIFRGHTWIEERDGSWSNVGWSRISVRRDGIDPLFEGTFTVAHDSHHIQLRSNYMQTKHLEDPHLEHSEDEYMVIFRDSDIGQDITQQVEMQRRNGKEPSCSAHTLSFNSDPQHPIYSTMLKRDMGSWGSMDVRSLFGKRQIDNNGLPAGGNSGGVNLKLSIGSTNGCPNTRKVALIGVATDCSYTGTFNSSESARANVIAQINSASDLYEKTFNITLGLQNLTIMDSVCPGSPPQAAPWNVGCGGNNTITTRLNTFSQWRGDRPDNNAYWTLLTNCPTGAEVGLAWLGQACVSGITQGQGETVSGANVVARTSTEWQVIAHESGHTFGAVHDCDRQTCADGNILNAQQCCPLSGSACDASARYIMNPSTGPGITAFSPCTVGNICSALLRNSVKSSCLADNKGVTTISGHQCGNGIVEEGEECDCGGPAGCGTNKCCNPTTCKFNTGAVCDDSNEDCCRSCRFASAGTVCRSSTGSCDPQETCSGTNATCPPDVTAPNGQSCANGLSCASGQCTSRDLQCKTLMGAYTSNNDTYACNSQDCMLSCASPQFGPGECYSMQQNFLDGTSCGGGGTCSNGQCKNSSAFKEVGSWINDNKPLVIGIGAGVGGLLLLLILGCIVRRCRRPRRRPPPRRKTPSPPMQQAWHAQAYPPAPHHHHQAWPAQGYPPQRHTGGWNGRTPQGPQGWNGPMPPPLPPRYGWGPSPSVRYA